MKLTKVSIFGFKSIKETLNIIIDEKCSILIGANDNGKTNILQAIAKLNAKSHILADEVNWDLPEGKTAAIDWYFSLDEQDVEILRELAETSEHEVNEQSDSNLNEVVAQKKYINFDENGCVVYRRDGVGTNLIIKSVPYKISVEHEEDILEIRPIIEFFAPVTRTHLKNSF